MIVENQQITFPENNEIKLFSFELINLNESKFRRQM